MSQNTKVPEDVVARVLKVARENPDLTSVDLARRFGLSPTRIGRMLRGQDSDGKPKEGAA